MGQITSGVGLISGINTADIIDQLIAIESRPKNLISARSTVLTSQQVALQEVNANLLSLKLSADGFTADNTFNATSVSSSNEAVLTATSSTAALPGTYDFTVARLVSSQQTISKGYSDTNATVLAPAGATFTFEMGDGRLDRNSALRELNGGEGMVRGKIRIADRSGASAVIDLSQATTVDEVLSAINKADGINVTASVNGDGFTITDNTGLALSNLAVTDVNSSGTTASLGLNAVAVGATLTGTDVNTLGDSTVLASLNDGNGVRARSALDDIQITTRDGSIHAIDLSNLLTIEDVINAIDTATSSTVSASVNGAGLQLTDSTVGGTTFAVAALNSSDAAADLGILLSDGNADGVISGDRVISSLNSKLISSINGGDGVTLGTVSVTDRSGAATNIDLSSASSVSDVLSLINNSAAGVTASLNAAGNGLLLTDTTGSTTSNLIVSDVSGTAAVDLNLASSVAQDTIDSGNLQFQYITEGTRLDSIRGGLGVTRGKFTITDSTGASATVDLTQGNEVTIQDVIDEINSRGIAVTARVNDNGDGILIEDTGTGAVALKIEEAGSTTAADLGILGTATNPGDDLNGSFETTVTIEATDTLTDIAQKINDAGIDVSASIINDGSAANPYRLSLASTVAGRGGSFVFDDGGLGLSATTLSESRNALVFYGSTDPAQAIAIESATNSLTSVVPGVTIDLMNTSDSSVRVAVTTNNSAIVDSVEGFVSSFNAVMAVIAKHDSYNAETEERGLLLGDPTVSRVQSSLYRLVSSRNTDLSGQYTSLTQIGIKVGSGARLEFDQAKFQAAMESDPEAVEALFTFKETETDSETNEITITSAGIGVRINELLATLTESVIQGRMDSIDSQIEANNKRLGEIDKLIEAKRARLEQQFLSMERALAKIQGQSTALNSLATLASQSRGN
jgi:flagellar hook-associated protein 2